jgi:Lrp/AsnC family transcriptional regulator, regulator for asnA, asnC and gidA
VDLDGDVDGEHGRLGGGVLGHVSGLAGAGGAGVGGPGGLLGHQAGQLHLDLGLGQGVGQALVGADGYALGAQQPVAADPDVVQVEEELPFGGGGPGATRPRAAAGGWRPRAGGPEAAEDPGPGVAGRGQGMGQEEGADTAGQGPVDEVDREIIRLLQKDGRTSNTDIARALDVTETTIRKRIARLIDEDLVNVVAVPTPRAVGMTVSAIIGISVQLPSLHAVSERLVGYPEVRYVGVATGRYDIIVEAFFNDQGHLLEFVSRKLGALKGVTGAETSLILKVAKFSYEWEIP